MYSTNQNAGFSRLQYSRNKGLMKVIIFPITRNSYGQRRYSVFLFGCGQTWPTLS